MVFLESAPRARLSSRYGVKKQIQGDRSRYEGKKQTQGGHRRCAYGERAAPLRERASVGRAVLQGAR